MQPLADDDEQQVMFDDTIHVSVTGMVSSSDKRTCMFHIHASQFVCGQHEGIAVRADMNKNPKWKNPSAVLPREKAIISFHSILDRFEMITPPNKTDPIKCVVVAVQHVSFLQGPQDNVANTAQHSAQKSVRDRVKRRKQKQVKVEKASPSAPENSQTMSVASSSQITLGKRVYTSDEENEKSPVD